MKLKNIFHVILAIIGGEFALVLLTTLAQEVIFDGISYTSSSTFELLVGGILTFIAAVAAGIIARGIMRRSNLVVPLVISLLITGEMTYLIFANKTGDPMWFDILAGLSLIAGIWLGFYAKEWFPVRPSHS